MNVISFKALQAFSVQHPEAEAPLKAWYKRVRGSTYVSFADVRADFGSADWVKGHIVFDIGGNKYRLIVTASFQFRTLWVKGVLTHKEYDAWKP